MRQKIYSLRKSRKILRTYYALFKRKESELTPQEKVSLERDLRELDIAVLSKNKQMASSCAQSVVKFCKEQHLRESKDISRELVFALFFALVVAFVIRQFWFELYEVPTGSMRPTIMELDRLAVSKTTFGIHLPFVKKPLLYKPELVRRAGIIVLTTAGMDLPDSNMLYFGIFPGKKRYVKRCVNKPGDTIYFYGGYIYGIDKEGAPFTELADPSFLAKHHLSHIDHIPFITFEGKTLLDKLGTDGVYRTSIIKQMNIPLVELRAKDSGDIEGLFYDGQSWVKDNPAELKSAHSHPICYSDLWGIGNFAMARLLSPSDAKKFYGIQSTSKQAELYLELQHSPNTVYPKPLIRRGDQGRIYPMLTPYVALIALQEEQVHEIARKMSSSRFCVKDGRAYPYQKGRRRSQPFEFDIRMPQIKDGCYEFDKGRAYRVQFGGYRKLLPPTDALYNLKPSFVQTLFNTGIGWNRLFEPTAPYQPYHPHRYAYYRDGDLYLMGSVFLEKANWLLRSFVENEIKKENGSNRITPYIAFIDRGPPLLADGSIDVQKIKAFGLKIPDHAVIGLGDNYAMSADSREFGFIPTDNLIGSPSFIFWPFTSRVGPLAQPPYPWLTSPNLVIWILAGVVIIACIIYTHNRNKRSIFK